MGDRHRITRRARVPFLLATALLAVPVLAATAAPAPLAAAGRPRAAAAPPALVLPAPTGRYPVGTTWLHLVDDARPDPWRPELRRELMVSIWYPALAADGPPAPYTTAAVSARIVEAEGLPLAADVLTTVRTNARRDVPVRPTPGGWPLVVLSPGFSLSRESLTGLAEELASHGYVVAGVDHPYEARGVEFPDGRVATCLACDQWGPGVAARVVRGRAADVSFLLDRLLGPAAGPARPARGADAGAGSAAAGARFRPVWAGARFVDAGRIGMAGHSIGGASAAETMVTDRRVDAGANLDGTFFTELPAGAVDRPFLMIGSVEHEDPAEDPSWSRTWANLAGWKRWLQVPDAGHMSFTDRPVLGAQLGLDPGAIPADRQLLITREYVRALFDRQLRGRPGPLLDGPSAAYPEVRFRTPAPGEGAAS